VSRRPARTRNTLRFLRSPLPFVGVATAAAIGTGVAAYGDWDVGAESATFEVRAASIPRMAAPSVQLPAGRPAISADGLVAPGLRIRWERVEIAPGTPVQRYVVTRHLGPIAQVACEVPAGRTRCVDEQAPAGYLATYTVTATYGSFWTGAPSKPSEPTLLPGEAAPIVVAGVVVLPGAGGAAVVPAPGVSASAPARTTVVQPDPGDGPAGPADPGGPGEPVEPAPAGSASQAPVIKPPEPPELPEESAPDTGKPEKPDKPEKPENPSEGKPAEGGKNEGDTQKTSPGDAANHAAKPS